MFKPMTESEKAQHAIILAKAHLKTNESAKLCLDDALACLGRGDYQFSIQRALKSIAYSASIFCDAHRLVQSWVK